VRTLLAAGTPVQAQVTHWPARIGWTVLIIILTLGVMGLMRLGWRHRGRRQAGVPDLPPAPGTLDAPLAPTVDGVYVSTTAEGDWLDRIVVHGLGVRSRTTVTVDRAGVLFTRTGAPDVFVPAGSLHGVRRSPGMAGKFVGGDGLVVLTWALGAHSLDTGFKPDRAADGDALEAAVRSLLGERTLT
jgi:hypothetical protein